MRRNSKILSIVMSIILAVGMCPTPAFAQFAPGTLDQSPALNLTADIVAKAEQAACKTMDEMNTQALRALTSDGQGVVQVALSTFHSAAVKSDGTLWTWGDNYYGQLGDDRWEDIGNPKKIMDDVVQVALGRCCSAAVKNDDTLWMWGRTGFQFDDGTECSMGSTPTRVMTDVAKVSIGNCFTTPDTVAVVKTDGSLWTWGGESGCAPAKIMNDAVQVSLGSGSYAAVKTDGSLWTWGRNDYGQLGVEVGNPYTPTKIMEGVSQTSLGVSHSAAVKTDGSLWTWGDNYDGKLGDGTARGHYAPVKIMDGVSQVSLGGSHSAAVKTDGSLWLWGLGSRGELGDGRDDAHYYSVPTKIMEGVSQVSLGERQCSAAVKTDGSLWTWGDNYYCQLGDGTDDNRLVPTKIIDGPGEPSGGSFREVDVSTFSDGELVISKGQSVRLACSASASGVTWSSADSSIVSVNDEGVARGVKAGYVRVYANAANGTRQGAIYVHVIDTVGDPITVYLGESAALPSSLEPLSWSSDDESVAVVEGTEVTGLSVGEATLSATGASGLSYTCEVSVRVRTVDASFATDSGDATISFEWSPMLLVSPPCSTDASSFNREIAIAGLVLSGQAEQGVSAAEAAFQQLGLVDDALHVWSHDYSGLGVGNSIACVDYKSYGTTYKIVTVDIQGTRPTENLVPSDVYTFGFETTASAVLENMKSDVGITNLSDSQYRYFITGHSLGGAAASILAKKLLDAGCSREQVTAYTFAPPCTCGVTGGSEGCEDIKNIINSRDTIPKLQNVGTFDWRRNGSDFRFNSAAEANESAYRALTGHAMPFNAFNLAGVYLEEHHVQTYMSYLIAAAGSYEMVKAGSGNDCYVAIHCPVSVDVLDPDGNVVLSAPDGEKGSGRTIEGIQVLSDGDSKYVLLPEGCEDYSIRLTGAGEGTMSCVVQQARADDVDLTEPTYYENIALSAEKEFLVEFDSDQSSDPGSTVADAAIFVIDADSGAKTALVSTDGAETRIYDIADANIVINGGPFVYTGSAIEPAVSVSLGGKTLVAGSDYTVLYRDNTDVGTATVVASGIGAYQGTASATFNIVAACEPDQLNQSTPTIKNIAGARITGVVPKTYTGKPLVQSPAVRLDGTTLTRGTDYELSYASNLKAGTATMTVQGKGSYVGTKAVTFTIAKAKIKGATAAKVKARKYTGKAVKPSPKLTYKGKKLKKGTDYTLKYKNNKKRGTATITVKGKGSFKGSKTVKFKIK